MKTLTVDDDNRVRLPGVKPQQVFAYEPDASGRIVLTPVAPVEPRPAKVQFIRKNGYTVGVTEHPITNEAIKEALADFP